MTNYAADKELWPFYFNWLLKVKTTIVFPGLKWPPFFANYSLMVILIEKLIREINLVIYRVIEFIFST